MKVLDLGTGSGIQAETAKQLGAEVLASDINQEAVKFVKKKGIKTTRVVAKIGVNTEKFEPAENKENAKEFIGVEKSKKVLGFVGRLTKEKDVKTLYDGFKRLEGKYNNLFLNIFLNNLIDL